MDLQWINGTDSVAEMATKSNVNFNALEEGVGEDILEVKAYADTVSATAKTQAITETQTWAKGTFSNPNMLRNSDFLNPINQRVFTSITSSNVNKYTIDGWYFYANSASNTCQLVSGGIKLTNIDAMGCRYGQFYDINDVNKYAGKTVTLTLEYVTNVNISLYATANGVHTLVKIFLPNLTKDTITFTFPNGSDKVGLFFQTDNTITKTATLSRIKLELGSVATPFVPRPYGEELALCQRFYRPLFFTPQRITIYAPTYVLGYVEYDRSAMRANPVIVNGNAGNVGVGNVSVGTAISGFEISLNVYHHWVRILATKSAHGLTDAIFTVTESSLPLCYLDAEIY